MGVVIFTAVTCIDWISPGKRVQMHQLLWNTWFLIFSLVKR